MTNDPKFPAFDTFNDARSHLLAVIPQAQHLPTLSAHSSTPERETEIHFDPTTATGYWIGSADPAFTSPPFIIDALPGEKILSECEHEITDAVMRLNDPAAYTDADTGGHDRKTDLAAIDEANTVELACMRVDGERHREELMADPPYDLFPEEVICDPIESIEVQLRTRIEEARAEMTRLAMARAMHMRNLLQEYPSQHGAKAAVARRLGIPAQSVHDALNADARRRAAP